jgi:hypothetical protein
VHAWWLVLVLASAGCDRVFQLDILPDAPPSSGTLTFGETGTATHAGVTFDTYLELMSPTLAFGGQDKLYADGLAEARIALIRFDVTAIPADAQVVSASLRLRTTVEPSNALIVLTRMLEAWDEGTSFGMAGTPNWTQRTLDTNWSTPGAAPPSRGTDVVGSVVPSSQNTSYDVELDRDVVASWVADPASNFGLAMVNDAGDAVAFVSRSVTPASDRPLLTVEVAPP